MTMTSVSNIVLNCSDSQAGWKLLCVIFIHKDFNRQQRGSRWSPGFHSSPLHKILIRNICKTNMLIFWMGMVRWNCKIQWFNHNCRQKCWSMWVLSCPVSNKCNSQAAPLIDWLMCEKEPQWICSLGDFSHKWQNPSAAFTFQNLRHFSTQIRKFSREHVLIIIAVRHVDQCEFWLAGGL